MLAPAATRSAGRLHPRNWAPAFGSASVVLLFVVIFLGASALIHGTPWAASATRPECNNRIDDDGDGKIDYPSDPGCTGRGDKSEVDPVEPPPPPPPPGSPALEPVDGGPNYYAQFSNPLPPDKFPVGAWLVCLDVGTLSVDPEKSKGINVYIAPCRTGSNIPPLINAGGMKMIAQDEWLDFLSSIGAETAAWMGLDEIDMLRDPAQGCQELQQTKATLPLNGRFFYNNFAKGVNFWQTDAEAACYISVPEVISSDEYWFSDNNVCSPSEGGNKPGVITSNNCHVAANYGWTVQRNRSLVSPFGTKPMWNFVEVACPYGDTGWPCITPTQIRAAVWHSLIAGARGIEYFVHSFKGTSGCGSTANVLRDPCYSAQHAMVTSVNAQIQSLAGVLKSPKLTSGFSASGGVRTVAKWDGSNFYVLAGAVPGAASETFSIPCVGNATATVVGESRSVPVVAGAFTDSFANPDSVHIYRVDGGSTCGLT
jgi:hypothetical protein